MLVLFNYYCDAQYYHLHYDLYIVFFTAMRNRFWCITIIMTNWNQNVLDCRLNVNARSLNGLKYMHDFCFDELDMLSLMIFFFLIHLHASVNCLLVEALSVYVSLFTDERRVTQRSSRVTGTNTNAFITASLNHIRAVSPASC